jgi:hypothetical protein
MATPKKPGQRVMLMASYGDVREGQIGRVASRLKESVDVTTWHVTLDSGRSIEVHDQHLLHLVTE